MSKQDLTLTESLKEQTVVEMLIRLSSHYPNSGHTKETLKVVAEDWFYTFKDCATDRAFIEAVTKARRKGGGFFPTESDVFDILGIDPQRDCKKCGYYHGGTCNNLSKENFDVNKCGSFTKERQERWI